MLLCQVESHSALLSIPFDDTRAIMLTGVLWKQSLLHRIHVRNVFRSLAAAAAAKAGFTSLEVAAAWWLGFPVCCCGRLNLRMPSCRRSKSPFVVSAPKPTGERLEAFESRDGFADHSIGRTPH